MSTTVLYMSMSLDGFIAGPNAGPGNGLGDGGERLHDWVGGGDIESAADRLDDADRAAIDDFMSTGAVLAGRGTFEPAGGWQGDHHDGVPIFIVSRHEPPTAFADYPNVTYLSDLAEAVRRAKDAAGDRGVLVHGAGSRSACFRPGSSTRSRSTSCRSCSARAGVSSSTSAPSTSSSSPSPCTEATRSPTCATAFAVESNQSLSSVALERAQRHTTMMPYAAELATTVT